MVKGKVVVEKITEEPNPKGAEKLRVTISYKGIKIDRGVKKSDYLNEAVRRNIHKTWTQTIKAMYTEAEIKKDLHERQKDKAELDALIGKEIEEED